MATGASFDLRGLTELKATLGKLVAEQRQKAGGALYRIAEQVMRESKEQTPVDVGTLRASGTVFLPEETPDGIQVRLGFGGAAEDYAIVQHEDLTFKHTVGNAKFLERPLLDRARTLEADLAAEMKA